MSDDKKRSETLSDDDMLTSPKLSRRLLIAGAGVALGAATLGSKSAFADDTGKDAEMDKGGSEEKDDGKDDEKDDEKDEGGEEEKDEGNDEEMSEKDSD